MDGLTRGEVLRLAGGVALAAALPLPAARAATGGARRSRRLRALASAVRGPVLTPGQRGFRAAADVYNARWDGSHPVAVVRPRDVADVQAAVRWAGRYDVPVVPRSGGHGYTGNSTTDAGIVLDLRGLRAVGLRDGGRRVRAGAGAQLVDVDAALAAHGVAVPAGSCPSVGLGGLALGGGMGLAGRAFGLTLDNVVALTVVTADGRRRRVDASHDPDLFWALRGGGGSFGVVTDLTLRTHRVRRANWCSVRWPAGSADAALQAWLAFAPEADPDLTMLLTIAGGRVSALGQHLGPASALRRLLRPLAAVPGAVVTTGTAGWLDLQRRWAGCLDTSLRACHTTGTRPGGRLPRARFAASSLYLGGAQGAAGRRALLRASEPRGGASGTLLLDAYGGAIATVGAGATAFVHRDVRCSVQVLSYAPGAAGWVASARAAIAPHATGAAYQNYADRAITGWRRAYYGAAYGRLLATKRRVDPDERFRFVQSVGS